ncbi:MAG: ATP-binding protein [Acidobacteriota bacterium]
MYAEILENISIGALAVDVIHRRVIFQNRAATMMLEGMVPGDYEALRSVLPELDECMPSDCQTSPRAASYAGRALGYSMYRAIEGYYWVFLRDITERIAKEQERLLLTAAVESADQAIAIADRNGIISYVNSAVARITRHVREELIGQHIQVLVRDRDNDAERFQKLSAIMGKGEVWSDRMTARGGDGSLYIADMTISPVRDASGEIINYVVFQTDVTEKARLESIAEAVDLMNNAGCIFAGIRHEIGNPINSIKMALSVLKANLDSYSREATAVYVDRALCEIARVEYLLRALKSFNLYERLSIEDVPVAVFMAKFLSLARGDFEKRGVQIRCVIHPEVDGVRADPRALQQLLLNVLANASDALEGVDEPKVVISIYQVEGRVRMAVTDNGQGIAEEDMDQLFKPFFTTKTSGTGLGLMLTRKMLAKMGGTIEITSCRDAGTIAELDLPGCECGQR